MSLNTNTKNISKVYIHYENCARLVSLVNHIKNYNPDIQIIILKLNKNYEISLLEQFNNSSITNTYIGDESLLFVLSENAIAEYGQFYETIFNRDQCVFPTQNQLQLETSKIYCRNFVKLNNMSRINPSYTIFNNGDNNYLTYDYKNKVIKADGLADGKGVFVWGDHFTTNLQAVRIIDNCFETHKSVIIEEKLIGEEFSLISLCWKDHIEHLPLVKDFKRLYDDDKGPNTGGMGTITFPDLSMPFLTDDELQYCYDINLTIAKKTEFRGFLYGSFMKTYNNEIKLIEYNTRLGDSESINIFALLNSSLINYLVDPDRNPFTISLGKYTFFRYMVPIGYPDYITNDDKYFVIDKKMCLDVLYLANCNKTCLLNVYEMTKSRTCGILTIDKYVNNVIADNDKYINMIHGNLHYRTDLGKYFNKTYNFSRAQNYNDIPNQYIGHLTNYNHIISNTKEFIDIVNTSIENANPDIKIIGKIGDFANSIEYKGTKLICSVDGAGTKTKFLENNPNRFRILGSDIIIHNINDMYCNNGRPIAVLDYYGCDKLDKVQFSEFVEGMLSVCSQYEIPLIGGETVEMKGIFASNEIEVLGILLGIIDKTPLNGNNITEGNFIYGIKSNGSHTNGYTKLRELDAKYNMPTNVKNFLSQAHKSYVPSMQIIEKQLNLYNIKLQGKAHIKGGGFEDNIKRIFPENSNLKILLDKWELCDEWKWVFNHSNMLWDEFIRVFNAGWGFCFITDNKIEYEQMIEINEIIKVSSIYKCEKEEHDVTLLGIVTLQK
jgi:phosphoribosylamine--glycine ligase/phosphoribosylformylglycinamidine cyclo-ligase